MVTLLFIPNFSALGLRSGDIAFSVGVFVILSMLATQLIRYRPLRRFHNLIFIALSLPVLEFFIGIWVLYYLAASLVAFGILKWIQKATRKSFPFFFGITVFLFILVISKIKTAHTFEFLGLSYFVFRAISSFVESYRGQLDDMTLAEYLNYSFFFPAFASGPIMRGGEFLAEARGFEAANLLDVFIGSARIAMGIIQALIIAPMLRPYFMEVFNHPESHIYWTYIAGFYLPILYLYLNFAGYSDIAIGVGKLLGVTMPENFNKPFLQTDILLFWRNWHMTLQRYIRDYFYLPLFYKNPSELKMYVGIILTMLLFCIWHQFTWNYFVIGLYEGGVIVIYLLLKKFARKWGRRDLLKSEILSRIVTFLVVSPPIGLFFVGLSQFQTALGMFLGIR